MNHPKITERTTDKLLEGTAGIMPSWGAPSLPSAAVTSIAAPTRDPLKPEKVAIMGTQPASRMQAPFGDLSWTIWGSSPGNMGEPGNPNYPGALPRIDAWIEVHSNFMWQEYRSYGEPYVRWLSEQKFPVLTPKGIPSYDALFKTSQAFPWRELVDEFGPYFFTSTFAWMMAFAIKQGVKEIGMYGVDMSSKDEYILQRPGGHHFILEAKRRGIKVTIPDESDLVQPPPLYGIFDSTPIGRKLAARRAETNGRIQAANMRIQQAQQEATYLSGALEDIDYTANIWGAVGISQLMSVE